MFRKMVRQKQALTREECIGILKREMRGVLSVLGDDGYPYGVPMDFWYDEQSGLVYFHSGKYGHKVDALARCDKVSFCVMDGGYRREGEWALNIRSVIVFGRVSAVADSERAMEICRRMSYKYTPDEEYIEEEIRRSGPATLCLELRVEHISGKLVNES